MVVDCDTCIMRGPACSDCVLSVLLGEPSTPPELDQAELAAVATLATCGLIPPLRLRSAAS